MNRYLAIAAAISISTGMGWVTLRLLVAPTSSPWGRPIRGALAVGVGLGITSCLYFFWLALSLQSLSSLVALEMSLLILGCVAVTRRVAWGSPAIAEPPARRGAQGAWLLGPPLGVLVSAAAYAFWYVHRAQPHGAWDAFAMYNARARFLFRGGEHWLDAFEISPLFHPDYPALVPGSVARLWTYAGGEATLAPGLVAFLFAAATVILLFGCLAERRGIAAAVLATLLLCGLRTVQYGNDSLVLLAATQLADVPFGFFVLSALCLALPRAEGRMGTLAAAGLLASLAAWCKNEGTLFFVVLLLALCLLELRDWDRRRATRRVAAVLLGASPVLVWVASYKVWLAPSGEILSGSNVGVATKILDLTRYAEIGSQVGDALLRYGGGALVAFGLAIVLIGLRDRSEWWQNGLPALAVLGTWAGYLAVFITPHDLAWHVLSSKYRLLTQLWPAALLAGFLLARNPEIAFGRLETRTPERTKDETPDSR